jgi:hypothetical protein
MSLNAIAFLGSTPIGAPLLGYVSDVSSPRVALGLGAVATLLASIPLFALAARQRGAHAVPEAAEPPTLVPLTLETDLPKLGSESPLREPEMGRRSG